MEQTENEPVADLTLLRDILSSVIVLPMTRIHVSLQMQNELLSSPGPSGHMHQGYTSYRDAARRIYAAEGIGGFWVGTGLTVAKLIAERLVPRVRITEAVNNRLFSAEEMTVREAFGFHYGYLKQTVNTAISRTAMSTAVACVTQPFELVYTRYLADLMMNDARANRRLSTGQHFWGVLECAAGIWRKEGPRGFYAGVFASLFISVISHFALQISFDALRFGLSNSYDVQGHFLGIAFLLGNVSTFPFMTLRRRVMVMGGISSGNQGTTNDVVQTIHKADEIVEREGVQSLWTAIPLYIGKHLFQDAFEYLFDKWVW